MFEFLLDVFSAFDVLKRVATQVVQRIFATHGPETVNKINIEIVGANDCVTLFRTDSVLSPGSNLLGKNTSSRRIGDLDLKFRIYNLYKQYKIRI